MSLHTCELVYQEIRRLRVLFRRELLSKGFRLAEIGRILHLAELKVKEFMSKIQTHDKLSDRFLPRVEAFYAKHSTKLKTVPPTNDKKILAQALNLKNLFFVTTDHEHFTTLQNEIEAEFDINIIDDNNANKKLVEWGWR
jgi:hypothetical protein